MARPGPRLDGKQKAGVIAQKLRKGDGQGLVTSYEAWLLREHGYIDSVPTPARGGSVMVKLKER